MLGLLLAVLLGGFEFRCESHSSVSNDVLTVDSTELAKPFRFRRYALTEGGVFRPGTRYEISFDARVAGADAESKLLVIVRPLRECTSLRDIGQATVEPTQGRWKSVRLQVAQVPDGDFRLQIHSHGRIRAEIAGLRVRELAAPVYVPAPTNAHAVARTVGAIRPGEPTGAKEFEVDRPCAANGPVIEAAAFGMSETNADNSASLRAALAEAKRCGAARLVVAKGSYRFLSDAPIALNGFKDFTFDGGGATFVSWRKAGEFFRVIRCERVKLRNFRIDWDWARDPLASLVRVTAVESNAVELTFVDYPVFPRRDTKLVMLSPYDVGTRSVGLEGGVTRVFDGMSPGKASQATWSWVAPNRVRVRTEPRDLAVGQLYRLQHYYYHLNGFTMQANVHLRLEDVTVLSTPGHAFVISGPQHHTLFTHVDIVAPRDDPRRIITCTADHLHMAQSRGFVKLEGCEFSLGADDIFNMHDCSGFAHKHGPRTVRTLNARAYGGLPRGTCVELRHGDYSPTGFFGTVDKVETVDRARAVYDITFTEEVPDEAHDGFVLFDGRYDTHNIIVRDCYFHDNRARGLLILARDVTVENNVFRHQEQGAVKIETGYTLNAWSEGYGVSNVVIRNNLFDNVNPACANLLHGRRALYTGIYLRSDPSAATTDYPIIRDLLIADNVFRDQSGVVAWISSAANVTFRDNVIVDPRPRRNELPNRSQVHLINARNIRVLDNDW